MPVSIALCTYDGEKFIREQINSFLTQTVLPDEIVICDDGSKDHTIAIIEELAKNAPGISWRIVQNEINLGASKNFEKAINLCTHDLIFLSDQDDIWKENKVEKVLAFFNSNPGCKAVFSNADLIDDANNLLEGSLLDHTFFNSTVRKNYKKEDLFYWSIMLGNIMTGATMAIRRTAFPVIFPFHLNPGIKLWHDGWIGFALMAKEDIEFLDERLIQYRVHSNQQIGILTEKDTFENIIIEQENVEAIKSKKEYFPRYLLAFTLFKGLKKIFSINDLVEEKIVRQYLEEKRRFFKAQPFFERKLRLVKWYLKSYPGISLRDVFKL